MSIPVLPSDKKLLCENSKVFCMFPWVHLYATPTGDVYPCCSNEYIDPIGNTRTSPLAKSFNCDEMKQLRLNMLNGIPSKICTYCYEHEKAGPYSFRTYSNEHFAEYFEEAVIPTHFDGTVDKFNMRYFDIRFSNKCNFKCRTCGAEFSSAWAKEHQESFDPTGEVLKHADSSGALLDEIIAHIPHMHIAYFAGGEPLITDEHYVLLNEMITQNRTDIVLRYNTNASTLHYKDNDLLELWSYFDKVEVSCSIDHHSERAEWLRYGTNWGDVENNLLTLRKNDNIIFQLNTVLSIFNLLTLPDFYDYMISKGLIRADDWYNTLYLAPSPSYYSSRAMPELLKAESSIKLQRFIDCNKEAYPTASQHMTNAISFANEEHNWSTQKDKFLELTLALDKLRNEDFFKVFPELSQLTDLD